MEDKPGNSYFNSKILSYKEALRKEARNKIFERNRGLKMKFSGPFMVQERKIAEELDKTITSIKKEMEEIINSKKTVFEPSFISNFETISDAILEAYHSQHALSRFQLYEVCEGPNLLELTGSLLKSVSIQNTDHLAKFILFVSRLRCFENPGVDEIFKKQEYLKSLTSLCRRDEYKDNLELFKNISLAISYITNVDYLPSSEDLETLIESVTDRLEEDCWRYSINLLSSLNQAYSKDIDLFRELIHTGIIKKAIVHCSDDLEVFIDSMEVLVTLTESKNGKDEIYFNICKFFNQCGLYKKLEVFLKEDSKNPQAFLLAARLIGNSFCLEIPTDQLEVLCEEANPIFELLPVLNQDLSRLVNGEIFWTVSNYIAATLPRFEELASDKELISKALTICIQENDEALLRQAFNCLCKIVMMLSIEQFEQAFNWTIEAIVDLFEKVIVDAHSNNFIKIVYHGLQAISTLLSKYAPQNKKIEEEENRFLILLLDKPDILSLIEKYSWDSDKIDSKAEKNGYSTASTLKNCHILSESIIKTYLDYETIGSTPLQD